MSKPGITLPPGLLEQRIAASQQQQVAFDMYHKQIAAQCFANLVHTNDSTEDLKHKAALAVKAATSLLAAYGVNVQLMNDQNAKSSS